MKAVSTLRLNLLRLFYLVLIIGIGLGMHVWSSMVYQVYSSGVDSGVKVCMLFALSVLSILGLRYPLQMLPVLFWEFTWKASWLLSVALPHWLRGQWSKDLGANTFAIGMIVIFIPLVPWSYVFENYVRKPGDRWWGRASVSSCCPPDWRADGSFGALTRSGLARPITTSVEAWCKTSRFEPTACVEWRRDYHLYLDRSGQMRT